MEEVQYFKTARDKNHIVSKLQQKKIGFEIAVDRGDLKYSGNFFHTSGAA